MCLWQDIQNLGPFCVSFSRLFWFSTFVCETWFTDMRKFSCLWSQFVSFFLSACLQETGEQQHVTVGEFYGLMWTCVLVIPDYINIRKFAPFLLVSTVLTMLGKKEKMIPLDEAVPGAETEGGSPQAPWPAWLCCKDAWQVKCRLAGLVPWPGRAPGQPRMDRAQSRVALSSSTSSNTYFWWPMGSCSLSCPGHPQGSVVWKISHWSLWAFCEQNENVLMSHPFLPPLQNTLVQQCISAHSSILFF